MTAGRGASCWRRRFSRVARDRSRPAWSRRRDIRTNRRRPTPRRRRTSSGAFRENTGTLADAAEKTGDLRRALLYRKVVSGFAPEDAEARARVERLERRIRIEADRHYRAALALEESGETAKALREFLAVLVLDPVHEAAFRRVKSGKIGKNGKNGKNGGPETDARSWTVREGDTLRKIAGEAYRDSDKDFLIAYFNHLPAGSPLPVGTELRLPDVDTRSSTVTEKAPRVLPPGQGRERPPECGPTERGRREESPGGRRPIMGRACADFSRRIWRGRSGSGRRRFRSIRRTRRPAGTSKRRGA